MITKLNPYIVFLMNSEGYNLTNSDMIDFMRRYNLSGIGIDVYSTSIIRREDKLAEMVMKHLTLNVCFEFLHISRKYIAQRNWRKLCILYGIFGKINNLQKIPNLIKIALKYVSHFKYITHHRFGGRFSNIYDLY